MSRRDDFGRSAPPKIDNMVSLKVDNLPYRTSVDKLKRIFSRYGDIGDIYIPRDPRSYESRGFAFVRYYDERDADDAIYYLDGKEVDGRDIRVQYAKYGRPSSDKSSKRDSKYSRNSGRSRRRSYSRSRSRSYSRSRSRSRRSSSDREKSPRRSRSYD